MASPQATPSVPAAPPDNSDLAEIIHSDGKYAKPLDHSWHNDATKKGGSHPHCHGQKSAIWLNGPFHLSSSDSARSAFAMVNQTLSGSTSIFSPGNGGG
jgi:hypothetical protein